MAILVKYPDGTTEIIARAVKIDSQNFHEGMYDFYDKDGTLLRQISLYNNLKWEITDEPEIDSTDDG